VVEDNGLRRMRLPAETLGVLSCFSRNLAAFGNFGLDATAFGVVGGTLVKLAFDEEEQLCEVGGGPLFDGRSQSLWNHENSFTF
jgi:hypothetical protein